MIKINKIVFFILCLGWQEGKAIDFIPTEERTADRRAIKSFVQNCKIDDLFKEHHLCQNEQEYRYVDAAVSTGIDLMYEGRAKGALPYFLYAEKYWHYDSISYLARIAYAAKAYLDVSPDEKRQIKEKFLTQLPNQDISSLVIVYKIKYEANLKELDFQTQPFLAKIFHSAKKGVTSWYERKQKSSLGRLSSDEYSLQEKEAILTLLTPHNEETDCIPFLQEKIKKE
jgi:hypothetical protein